MTEFSQFDFVFVVKRQGQFRNGRNEVIEKRIPGQVVGIEGDRAVIRYQLDRGHPLAPDGWYAEKFPIETLEHREPEPEEARQEELRRARARERC